MEHLPSSELNNDKQSFSGAQELLAMAAESKLSARSKEAPENSPADSDPALAAEVKQTLAERHPDWPPVSLNFYFSPHGTAEDMAGMSSHLKEADVYLFETTYADELGYTQTLQSAADENRWRHLPGHVNRLVKRGSKYGASFAGTAYETRIRSVYGSEIVVGNLDLRMDDPVDANRITMLLSAPLPTDGTFNDMLATLRERDHEIVELQQQREAIMAGRFEEKLEALMAAHPELKTKPELRVLVTMGANHTPLYHNLKAAGVDAKRSFPEMPYVYGHSDQALREIAFNREPSDDLLAKVYLGNVLDRFFLLTGVKANIRKTNDQLRYFRHVSSAFDSGEIAEVFNQEKSGKFTVDDMNSILEAKGLGRLPRTKEELEQVIAK